MDNMITRDFFVNNIGTKNLHKLAEMTEAEKQNELWKRLPHIWNDHLTACQINNLNRLINKNICAFAINEWDLGKTHLLKHNIITTTETPINIRPRRQPFHLEKKITLLIENMEKIGIIEKCSSPWNNPILCVLKKDKVNIRMCLDFRKLNAVSIRPTYPIPNVTELMDNLLGSEFFSVLDIKSAFLQIELYSKWTIPIHKNAVWIGSCSLHVSEVNKSSGKINQSTWNRSLL